MDRAAMHRLDFCECCRRRCCHSHSVFRVPGLLVGKGYRTLVRGKLAAQVPSPRVSLQNPPAPRFPVPLRPGRGGKHASDTKSSRATSASCSYEPRRGYCAGGYYGIMITQLPRGRHLGIKAPAKLLTRVQTRSSLLLGSTINSTNSLSTSFSHPGILASAPTCALPAVRSVLHPLIIEFTEEMNKLKLDIFACCGDLGSPLKRGLGWPGRVSRRWCFRGPTFHSLSSPPLNTTPIAGLRRWPRRTLRVRSG